MGLFTVQFVKSVKIENKRLAIMYYTLSAALLIFFIATFIGEMKYLRLFPGDGRVTFWVDESTWNLVSEEASKVNQVYGSSDICTTAKKYEYCDSAGCGGANWVGMKCMDLCTDEIIQDCLENTERWYKEDMGIFFPTYFNETVTVFDSGKKVVSNKQQITKGVEQMILKFDHEYIIHSGGSGKDKKGLSKDSDGNLLTILLDGEGKEIGRWEPGETVAVPLSTMLGIAGLDMNSVRDEYGSNLLEGAEFADGIMARLAGALIDLELFYTNINIHPHTGKDAVVCYIHINPSVSWTSKPMVDAFDSVGSHRLRYFQGLRVRFKASGRFGSWNFGNILSGVTSCLVFVGAAAKITKVFAITSLGSLSVIYEGFIRQNCSLERDACGLAARLTGHTSAFLELKDTKHGITRNRLNKRFQRIFSKETVLNAAEIGRLSDYVFAAMNWDFTGCSGDGTQVIDIEEYTRACGQGELVSIKSFIDIFDADRKKGFLEMLFVDGSLRTILQHDKEFRGEAGNRKSIEIKNAAHEQKRKDSKESPDALADPSGNGVPAISLTSVTTEQGAPEGPDDDDEEVDAIAEIHQNHEKLTHQLTSHHQKLTQDHDELKNTVHTHRSEMDSHQTSLDQVKSFMAALQEKLLESISNLEALQQNVQSTQMDTSKLESFGPELEKLKGQMQEIEQVKAGLTNQAQEIQTLSHQSQELQSDIKKLKIRGSAPQHGMVVEETTRRVISPDGVSREPEAPLERESTANSGRNREEKPCGIGAWDLCTERSKDGDGERITAAAQRYPAHAAAGQNQVVDENGHILSQPYHRQPNGHYVVRT